MENEHLNEEKYQRARKKIITFGLIIILIGVLIGGYLITKGFISRNDIENEYTEENKQIKIENLTAQYKILENRIQPQLDKIKELERVKFDGFNDSYYAREDEIEEIEKEIKPAEDQLQDLKNKIWFAEREDVEFQKQFNSSRYSVFFVIGGFIILTSLMIGASIIMQAYRRNIMAYGAQSVIPVAKEGIDEMAPSIGKAVGEVAKELKDVLKEEPKKAKYCNYCGKAMDDDSYYCKYCGKQV